MITFNQLIESPMHNLIYVNRYAGKQLNKQESVADHVWQMISLALELVPELNRNESMEDWIDLKEVIYRISVHDLDEAISFDVPRLFKYHNDKIHQAIEDTNLELMEASFHQFIIDDIQHSKDLDTKEGLIVKLLDHIQTWLKMKNELLIGNQLIRSEIVNVKGLVPDIRDIINNSSVITDSYKSKLHSLVNDWYDDIVKLL